MMNSFEAKACNDISVNTLVMLKENGVPVTLTSHPGNASLYKLSMWSCGIPETLWDITCVRADRNNQPECMLVGEEKKFLVDDKLLLEVLSPLSRGHKYVTAYQTAKNGERLGRIHVRAMEKEFPNVISSQSKLLLTEKERVLAIFEYLAGKYGTRYFPRTIRGNGTMVQHATRTNPLNMAESALSVTEELRDLLFSDEKTDVKGGLAYGGVLVQLICLLCNFWKTGSTVQYFISGPDMIRYAIQPKFCGEMSLLLDELHRAMPGFVPHKLKMLIPDGTIFRVGEIAGGSLSGNHASRASLNLHNMILRQQAIRRGRETGERMGDVEFGFLKDEAIRLHAEWPISIDSANDAYFSQHDLAETGARVFVRGMYKDTNLSQIMEQRERLKNILRV